MLHDVYQDQMIQHPSLHWTPPMLQQLHAVLTSHGWARSFTNKIDYARYNLDTKNLTINLTHNPPDDGCDFYIGDCVTPSRDLQLWPEIFGVYQHDFLYSESAPTKTFNCFINRGCSIRQSWFYFLVRHNLLDQGHVSFWCEDRAHRPRLTPQENFEYLYQAWNQPQFDKEHIKMRGQIPFKNFNLTLEQAIIDSSKSLVIESFFAPNHYITYSEKTWRAIQLPRPSLWFSSQHAVKYLRDWGFDVFDDVVDHSYDAESDQFVRQQMILEQLPVPIKYDAVEFEKRAQHNRDLLKSYRKAWPDRYKKVVDQIAAISINESLTSRA